MATDELMTAARTEALVAEAAVEAESTQRVPVRLNVCR
jgi:hypothetical protein